MRSFDIPSFYCSDIVSDIKRRRREADLKKRDLSPTLLKMGKIDFLLARHFGFCYGVENAIEIAYRALYENPGKTIYLLSEMIHNPHVNGDLESRGVKFIIASDGRYNVKIEELSKDDIVIVPAFGTTVEIFEKLKAQGVNPQLYDATCPFVERVWRKAAQLGELGFTVIIHGKHSHEETRATFSHTVLNAPSLVLLNIQEAQSLASFIRGESAIEFVREMFADRVSKNFDFEKDLTRIGVVNQTTMLASETAEISRILRDAIAACYSSQNIKQHFADTKDTLCYATNENQDATIELIKEELDLAIVVGGYNSSNTSHLAELLQNIVPTYLIKDQDEIISRERIRHLELSTMKVIERDNWLDLSLSRYKIAVTAGASSPDVLVEGVLKKLDQVINEDKKDL
jgi:4-hydroxy-3-methylbut-2-enyl diphosphate reductase